MRQLNEVPTRLLRLILFGIVLDLIISGVLSYQVVQQQHNTDRLNHVTKAAQCWDRVLDQAVGGKTSKTVLEQRASLCAKLIP